MQITGEEAEDYCEHCKRSSGPFAQCIVSDACGLGACAGCHYNSEGIKCSFRQDVKVQTDNNRDAEGVTRTRAASKRAQSMVEQLKTEAKREQATASSPRPTRKHKLAPTVGSPAKRLRSEVSLGRV